MVESSIFLILAFAIIVVQGNPVSNTNSNSNTNTNTNTNLLHHRDYSGNLNNDPLNSKLPAYYDDDDNENSKTPSDEIRDKLNDENPEIASAATAAADAAMTIAQRHADDLSESMGVGVADAVARILTDRTSRGPASRSNRRNANYNSNSNMNIMATDHLHKRDKDPITDEENDPITSSDLLELESNLGAILGLVTGANSDELGSSVYDYPSETNEFHRGRGTGGIYRDDEDENGVEKSTLGENLVVDDSLEHEDATLSPKPFNSREWDQPVYQNLNTNLNSNANSNRRRAFRRNMNRNMNTNANIFRRNINSNSNVHMRRHNLNSNVNKNKINRGNRYRRN